MSNEIEEIGTIREGEYHPSANGAMAYVRHKRLDSLYWMTFKEAVASTALAGNRLSEILLSTMERLDAGKPVGDRYLLGLAWHMKMMEEDAVTR